MLIERAPLPVALFVFAHQDDEFGVYQAILDALDAGMEVHCVYFTDGQTASATSTQRNRESQAVLTRLGVAPTLVHFAGAALGIGDGQLRNHLAVAAQWLIDWSRDRVPTQVFVPAWEGGHPDHDSLHALTLRCAASHWATAKVRQFGLYHRERCVGPLFRVLSPLASNGPVQQRRIPWRHRLWFLALCCSYPSQTRSWIGLLPFVAWHYLLRGQQELQGVSLARITERPHLGTLYYEQRGFLRWEQLQTQLAAWQYTS